MRLTAELQAAHAVQMSIMPQSDPEVAGFDISGICIPANEVGGDFYDYMWFNADRTVFGIAVGDVAGKAMKAAMIAVMSNGMISSRSILPGTTAEILTQLNGPMHDKTEEGMFTALCLASLVTNTNELIFTNAGFNSPLHKTNGTARLIDNDGSRLPLGTIRDTSYVETKIQLQHGDVIVFFSDGIPDARNKAEEFYESETLLELLQRMDTRSLSAREIKNIIIDDVMRFSGKAPQNDDMTVVVVKSVASTSARN